MVRFAYSILNEFTEIYPEEGKEQRMPDKTKLTVFCKGSSEEGFFFNVYSDELGLEALIAFKWIDQLKFNRLYHGSKTKD